MNVLLIGKLAREHALGWWAAKSALVDKVYLLPEPSFQIEGVETIGCRETDVPCILKTIDGLKIDLAVVSCERAIAQGVTDALVEKGVPVFAPSSNVAFLQASKSEAKFFMQRNRIPTPRFKAFSDFRKAAKYARGLGGMEMVVKADGLSNGKGTAFLDDSEDIVDLISDYMIEGRFGKASESVVIEDFVYGYEVTAITVSDGTDWRLLALSRAYKRLFDGDRGPSTIGMGAFTPFDTLVAKHLDTIRTKIIEPTYVGIKNEGLKFKGVLQFSIIISETGPKLISYDVRLGSPEGETLLHILKDKFFEIALATANGKLSDVDFSVDSPMFAAALAIVPNTYPISIPIDSIIEVKSVPSNSESSGIYWEDVKFKHGLAIGQGGRMAVVVASADSKDNAKAKLYEFVSKIKMRNAHFRKDIGV